MWRDRLIAALSRAQRLAAEPHYRPMTPWHYGPAPTALDLADNTAVLRAVRLVLHVLLRAYLRLFHGFRPARPRWLRRLYGHVIVANHTSHLDALVLMSAFPLRAVNRVRSLCAADYFATHPLRRTLAFLLANTIPMARDRFDRRAIAYCRRCLADDGDIIVFSEGTRSADGKLGEFKAGVGLLALTHGLPILPAHITGAFECCRKGTLVPRPGRIDVTFGRPVRYGGLKSCKRNWQYVAADVRWRVRALAAPAGKEHEDHDLDPDHGPEDARAHAGPAQRRRDHRAKARVHVGKDARLRVSQSAVRTGVDRQTA